MNTANNLHSRLPRRRPLGIAVAALMLLALGAPAVAEVIKPGDFNVYSLGNIGTSRSTYGSDFQGLTGAGGSVYFSGFSLTGQNTVDGQVLLTGGSVTLRGGDFYGSVSAGGDVRLNGFSVTGNVASGGNVRANGGWVSGSVSAAGSVSLGGGGVVGTVSQGAAFNSLVDFTALNNFYLSTSSSIAAMTDTGSITNQWGGLSYTASSGVNVLSIDAQELQSAWGFNVSGPADAVIYINVLGADVSLDSLNWSFSGGVGSDDVLLNYSEAQRIALSGGGATNILAPKAALNFSSGVWDGSIVTGNLEGHGQVNLGAFSHYDDMSIPEPATLALLALGGLMLLRRRRAHAQR